MASDRAVNNMSDFHKLLVVQFVLGVVLFVLGLIGMAVVLFSMSGCAPSSSSSQDRSVQLEYQQELQRTRAGRCREMLEEGNIDSMREWCQNPSVREPARRHACELVQEYDLRCRL